MIRVVVTTELPAPAKHAHFLDDCLKVRGLSRAVRSLGWDTETACYRHLAASVRALRDRGATWSLISRTALVTPERAKRLYVEGAAS